MLTSDNLVLDHSLITAFLYRQKMSCGYIGEILGIKVYYSEVVPLKPINKRKHHKWLEFGSLPLKNMIQKQ
ncbi:MAG: hypothetical protein C4617_04915 [Candidatus Liberibacter europaeus]|uniref:Uncharacterized protein n=1 Tax=Candidatus Liberibacter europaeus TaxID=744859 RepID=A0A2T4VWQ9_9HYPH|nr:hypothetical protein [Candidatus Liberibacter europaeus]PTL86213.1 MAG: hypothetical protein C4617_04915 [Candidatus Liberibacter europaeus]